MAATHTTNLGLNKPARGDFVSVVSDINDNMDKIDAKFGDLGEDSVADKFTGIDNEIGNTELPTTAQTLTGAIDEHEEDLHGTGGIDDQLSTQSAEISAICQTITGTTNNTGHTINSGEYFIANGGKYQATASIPNGQTWSDKSTAVSDNDIINALNSKLTSQVFGGKKAIIFKKAFVDVPAENGYTEVTYDFPSSFSAIPLVVASLHIATDARKINVIVKGITTSSVTFRVGNSYTSSQSGEIIGIAIG